jgi:hypothetical protein
VFHETAFISVTSYQNHKVQYVCHLLSDVQRLLPTQSDTFLMSVIREHVFKTLSAGERFQIIERLFLTEPSCTFHDESQVQ